MTRWEYCQLYWWTWVETTGEGGKAQWYSKAGLGFGDGRPDEQIAPRTPTGESTFDSLVELNRLGTQGWELVTVEVQYGAFVTTRAGGNTEAQPMRRRWWLKRPVSSV